MIRVDTPNPLLRILIIAYGWVVGGFVYFLLTIWRKTLHIEGSQNVKALLNQRYVLALWHEDLIVYFLVFNKVYNQVWMNHPAWFMKPIHVLLYLTGADELILGSSGNSGKQALEKVIRRLCEGKNTVVAVDGPAGPAKIMKPGALIMARNSQIPYVTLGFKLSNYKRISGWDSKRIPMPFSRVAVKLGSPQVIAKEEEIAESRINQGL